MTTKPEIYIGIDPGYSVCGIASISFMGVLEHYTYIEHWTPKEFYDTLINIQRNYTICKVGVEYVHSMPGQGVASTGKFMKATGTIIGTLNGLQISFIEITPQKWKTISPIFKGDKSETKSIKKAKSLEFVRERHPYCNLHERKITKKIKIDIADAICIATYMYDNFGSNLLKDTEQN